MCRVMPLPQSFMSTTFVDVRFDWLVTKFCQSGRLLDAVDKKCHASLFRLRRRGYDGAKAMPLPAWNRTPLMSHKRIWLFGIAATLLFVLCSVSHAVITALLPLKSLLPDNDF